MKEAAIVRSIQRLAAKLDVMAIKIHGGPLQQAGLPDLLLLANGRALFLEVKAEGGEVSKLQWLTLEAIAAKGIATAVVWNKAQAEEKMREVFGIS